MVLRNTEESGAKPRMSTVRCPPGGLRFAHSLGEYDGVKERWGRRFSQGK